jgi:hypothetical protein
VSGGKPLGSVHGLARVDAVRAARRSTGNRYLLDTLAGLFVLPTGFRDLPHGASIRLARTATFTDRNLMTVCAISPSAPASTPALLDEAPCLDGAALPISGRRLRQRLQRNGRVAIEINDDTGDLVGLITSTTLPMPSLDGAWRGRTHVADGTPRRWALAIGHATSSDDDPAVTFTRRLGPHASPRRSVVRPTLLQWLWTAAIPGLHTTVTCRQGPEQRIRSLGPVPRSHAHA